MANFDSFNYDIKSKMPEWWKEDKLAVSVNRYTQELLSAILESLLTSIGVVQPLNVWKTIPEEYDFYHHYTDLDDYLIYEDNEGVRTKNPVATLFKNSKMIATLPNTKRECHAKIHLELKGGDLDVTGRESSSELISKDRIERLILTNAHQQIIFKNISKASTIDIFTESNQILIDGEERDDLIEGSFEKIKPSIKYEDYKQPNIDETGQIIGYSQIDLEDENKETNITLEFEGDNSSESLNFSLQVYLLKPTYTTEQNIRISTVSAFPIESVKLYGYFCHPFNNKEGYKLLWTKNYTEQSRTVYDRITKQFDCERFCVKVKFHGIDFPLRKGFPQTENETDIAFRPNPNLDRWGKVYGLPRRHYKTHITEDEEPFTFPKYYNYPIEQDFWYEERLVNEYKYDEDAVNSYFIKDSDLNNIARLECISPTTNDVFVYTETIDPKTVESSIQNIPLKKIEEIESDGVEINDYESLPIQSVQETTIIKPFKEENFNDGKFSYQTKKYKCSFCLREKEEKIPKDIKITGIELKIKNIESLNSNSLKLRDDSVMILPFISSLYTEYEPVLEKINITNEEKHWKRDDNYFIIGENGYLFGEESITREQLFNGNDGKLEFEIGFINESDYLDAHLNLNEISLNIYYEKIPIKYNINVDMKNPTIILGKNEECSLNITVTNLSNKSFEGKDLYIAIPPELKFKSGVNCYNFGFSENEKEFTIPIVIEPKEIGGVKKTGYYDIIIFCEDKFIKKEVLVRTKNEFE